MVELDAATLQRIYRAQAANGYPARAPAAAPAGEQLAPSRPPLPEPRDTQLEAALRYLRGRLMEMNPAPAPAAAGAGS
ncbi:MAG: hypothetical protein KatS3mg102_0580 [Planctomycetota bacterium]|nr:MAG: hypothetical protein KatS3mg102_0580 [Planctomycetota bacterium]